MTHIAILGATGRMGKALTAQVLEDATAQLSGATVRPKNPLIGTDIGPILGLGNTGIVLTDDVQTVIQDSDVVIDFTQPSSTCEHIRLCQQYGTAIIVGTTGFDEEQKQYLQATARKIPIVLAPNTSIGVNLLLNLLQTTARVLGQDSDIEIIETHHRYKKDAPSGTALKCGEVIAETLGRDLRQCAVYGREGIGNERHSDSIGFATIRAGDVIGDHTILFASLGERLELTHKASSRQTFAKGAVRAAHWLREQSAGRLYSMQDVLGLHLDAPLSNNH